MFDNQLPGNQVVVGLARGWLVLAVAALGVACLLAVALVLLRTPWIGVWLSAFLDFKVALVLHVDLSLIIWLLAIGGMLWTLAAGSKWLRLGWLGLASAALGSVLLLVVGFGSSPQPILNNYLPMLDSPLFVSGLLLVACGICTSASRAIAGFWGESADQRWRPVTLGLALSATTPFLVLLTLFVTYLQLPVDMGRHAYYEALFWGAGHALQFSYLFLLVVAWVWLAERLGYRLPRRWTYLAYGLTLLPLVASAPLALVYPPDLPQNRAGFTALMRYLSWTGIPVLAWMVLSAGSCGASQEAPRSLRVALFLSMGVLLMGLLVGALIRHDTLLVPAHYHGTTGAVNIALFGMVYGLLQPLGLQYRSHGYQCRQLWVYAVGLVGLVGGLTWSGLLGVARKVSGEAQGLESLAEQAAMLSVAVGAAVALLGIFLFLGMVIRSLGISLRPEVLPPLAQDLRGEIRRD